MYFRPSAFTVFLQCVHALSPVFVQNRQRVTEIDHNITKKCDMGHRKAFHNDLVEK